MITADLFVSTATCERTALPGGAWDYWPAWLDAGRADRCLAWLLQPGVIAWRRDVIRIQGREIPVPRLTAWYGDAGRDYAYSGIAMQALPWNRGLATLRAKVEATTGHAFNAVLLNLYRDGRDSVAWHADDEPELGAEPVIASLSFGVERDFLLRHRARRVNGLPLQRLTLAHGSLLLMHGATQRHWEHCVPKRTGVVGPRVNLTFRFIHPDQHTE